MNMVRIYKTIENIPMSNSLGQTHLVRIKEQLPPFSEGGDSDDKESN